MAEITLYKTSIMMYTRGCTTLLHILKKAAESPDADTFPSAKLYEDMLTLTFQVQIATRGAKTIVEALTGKEPITWENNEKTMADLIKRVEDILAILNGLDPEYINSLGDSMISMSVSGGKLVPLPVSEYLFAHGLPNFFFHIVTAYDILRAKGVPLGKRDYISAFRDPYTPQA